MSERQYNKLVASEGQDCISLRWVNPAIFTNGELKVRVASVPMKNEATYKEDQKGWKVGWNSNISILLECCSFLCVPTPSFLCSSLVFGEIDISPKESSKTI